VAKVLKRTTLQIWVDVVYALFLREIKRKFNDKFGISWAVIQPVSFIFILSFIRGRMDGGETHSMPTFIFMTYGMISILFFLSTFNLTAGAIKKNKSLFAFRQVKPIASIIAVGFLELIIITFVIILMVVIMYFLRMELELYDFLTVFVNFLLIWVIAVSLGLIFALANSFVTEFDKVRKLAQRPLFFISGVFFSLQDIPQDMRIYLDWNPILHAIELSRQAAYPAFGAVGVSQTYVVMFALVTIFISLALYRVYWKQAISR